MLLHEYQVKSLLHRFQVPSLSYYLIESPEGVDPFFEKTHLESGVVKAQVLVGGRGKAGGVKIAKTKELLHQYTKEMFGLEIVNAQTGLKPVRVEKVLITPLAAIEKEFYIAIFLDRTSGRHICMASASGGVDIEVVAKERPMAVHKEEIDEHRMLRRFQLHRLMSRLGIEKQMQESFTQIIDGLVQAYFYFDATMLEINPFVITKAGTFLALDAKMTVDDNALFRQPELQRYVGNDSKTEREARAEANGLSYVSMSGSIGCVVNGAGLAMATMDIIKFWGGSAANFLDVGGGASEEKVQLGFDLVLEDPEVRVLFVNIFGGIMNCETIARALKASCSSKKSVPQIVARLEGTNVEGARALLSRSSVQIHLISSLNEAARMAVTLSAGASKSCQS